MAAMTTDQEMSMSELTRQALLELEGTVSHNRAKGYIARSQVNAIMSLRTLPGLLSSFSSGNLPFSPSCLLTPFSSGHLPFHHHYDQLLPTATNDLTDSDYLIPSPTHCDTC